ncbi:MAG: methyl-accepting chemotaxis protein [Solirubrobacterales bacterium]
MKRSIRARILSLICVVVIIAMGVSAAVSFMVARQKIKENATARFQCTVSVVAAELDGWFHSKNRVVEDLARSAATVDFISQPVKIENLYWPSVREIQRIKKSDPDMALLYTQSALNPMMATEDDEWVPDPNWKPETRPWYVQALETEKTGWVTPYLGDPTVASQAGLLVTTVSTPIFSADNKKVGVMAADFMLTKTQEIVAQSLPQEASFIFMVDKEGKFAVVSGKGITADKIGTIQVKPAEGKPFTIFPTKEKLTDKGASVELAKQITSGKRDYVKTSFLGVDGYLFYSPIKTPGWTMGLMIPQAVIDGAANQLLYLSVGILIIALLLVVIAVNIVARKISKPLEVLVEVTESMASGNLSEVELNETDTKEISALVRSFKTMLAHIRNLVTEVSDASLQIASLSEQLASGSEESAAAASQVAETVLRVANGAGDQVGTAQKSAMVVKEMTSAINHISANASEVSQKSERTAQAAVEGGQAAHRATAQMSIINDVVSKSAQSVRNLGSSSNQIVEIVDVITGIAEQTNLLALNAAIEAARAGEAGRGFAVVAQEVRNLAEQSREAAMQITQLITEIGRETTQVVETMQHGTDEVRQGTEVIAATGEQFNQIVTLIQDLNQQIQAISQAAHGLAGSSTAMVESVESVRQVAVTTADDTQTISAAAEEQSASMSEIAHSAGNLAQMAEHMRTLINRFNL